MDQNLILLQSHYEPKVRRVGCTTPLRGRGALSVAALFALLPLKIEVLPKAIPTHPPIQSL